MKNSAQIKPARKCIFCGEGGLSKEHIWPKWSGKVLPTTSSNEHIEHLSTFTELTKLVGRPKVRKKSGNTYTKTVRVVCTGCNNGWMSALESAALPILSPLISTEPCHLTTASLMTLSQWIALKVMVAEHNQRTDAVTPFGERKLFKETLQIPKNFHIWIAKCGTDGWEGAYWRHAATVGLSASIPPTGGAKNIHSITFGVGDLLIHVLHTSLDGLEFRFNIARPNSIMPIYPNSNPISWPPDKALSSSEAHNLSNMLDNFLKKRVIGWRSFPIK